MPQLRQNNITGDWVIIAPHRSARPIDAPAVPATSADAVDDGHASPHEATCPFCPGNEHDIPPIILELNSAARPWQTRVIPNKFPAVRTHASSLDATESESGSPGAPLHGRHEVIIESPRHDDDLARMSMDSVEVVVETYHRRYHEIRTSDAGLLPILFRNRGTRAGASLHHPHSQLIAVPLAPAKLRQEDEGAARYFTEHGRCPYCDQIEEESAAALRMITSNEHVVAFVPNAAAGPYEIIISPRRHCPDFGDATTAERRGLAEAIRTAVQCLGRVVRQPDYNYVIRSSVEYGASDPHLHWYLRIVPKLNQPGGFEVATGIPINPSNPEDDALRLRNAI